MKLKFAPPVFNSLYFSNIQCFDFWIRPASRRAAVKKIRNILLCGLLLFFAASCGRTPVSQEKDDEIDAILSKTATLMHIYPDSTLSILDALWRDNERRLTLINKQAIFQQRCHISRQRLDFDAAEAYCLRALEYANEANEPFSIASALGSLGVLETSRGKPREGINLFRQAIALLDEEQHQQTITANESNIAASFIIMAQADSALYIVQRILADAKRRNDLTTQASALMHISTIYSQLEKPQQSEAYVRKALPLLLQENQKPRIIVAYTNIANTLCRQDRLEEAIVYAQKADEMSASFGGASVALRNLYLGRARRLSDKGDFRNALAIQYNALAISAQRQDLRLMAGDYVHIGRTHLRLGNYDDAEYNLNKAIEAALLIENNPTHLRALRNLATLHARRGDIPQFEAALNTKEAIRDSLIHASHKAALQQMTIRYEKERNELLLAQKTMEIRYTRRNNILLSIILSLIMVLFVSAVFFHRRKMQNMHRIVKQHEAYLKYKKEIQVQEHKPEAEEEQSPSKKLALALQHLFETEKIYRQQGISANEVVEMLHTTHKHLTAAIKEHFQKGFVEYVNTFRVEEAIEMLKEQENGGKYANYSVEMIAEAVGFNSRITFYVVFKRILGVTPKEYMEILKRQEKTVEIEM